MAIAGLAIGLDFETFCELDIREVGMHKYIEHKSFVPLLVGVKTATHGSTPTSRKFDLLDSNSYKEFVDFMGHVMQVTGHNVDFEKKVLIRMCINTSDIDFIDSAVVSRARGGSSSLDNAVSQFVPGYHKMPEGRRLIKKFSIPPAEPALIDRTDPDWSLLGDYALSDADLGLRLSDQYKFLEKKNADVTREMNFRGWKVDMQMVHRMQILFEANVQASLAMLHTLPGCEDLNINSHIQLQKWCRERGINAKSFAEDAVSSMIQRISARLEGNLPATTEQAYREVLLVLQIKQEIGGSSLSKLQKIISMTSDDERLRGQYMHVGAGQSYRTSGTGVQMQNLKRLHNPITMEDLYDDEMMAPNYLLAENLRQVFTATSKNGALIVGDFSSVESRGLAYLAGAEWKLRAYYEGRDMYKVLAAQKFGVDYGDVDKEQRTFGKVGELSCGYGAGPGAVQSFAHAMGVQLTTDEATDLVYGWRNVNPEITGFWTLLDLMLAEVWQNKASTQKIGNGLTLSMNMVSAPGSLMAIHAGVQSLQVQLWNGTNEVMSRQFHGFHRFGNDWRYYKPCDTQKADWVGFGINPDDGSRRYFTLYGGKLAGILTQSFCREIFFDTLRKVQEICNDIPGCYLVGQFHDEIVLDWAPLSPMFPLHVVKGMLEQAMSSTHYAGFPLSADVKSDYRYTK